jgi:hypothetical protein
VKRVREPEDDTLPHRIPFPSLNRPAQEAVAPEPGRLDFSSSRSKCRVLRLPTKEYAPNAWKTPTGVTIIPDKPFDIPLVYDRAVLWPNGAFLLSYNTTYIPGPPSIEGGTVYICEDGCWGRHEYTLEPTFFDHLSPHLAFLPVPGRAEDDQHILFHPPYADDATRNADGRMVLSRATEEELKHILYDLRDNAKAAKEWCTRVYKSLPSGLKGTSRRVRIFMEGRFPSTALANALEAFRILQSSGVQTVADFRLVWHAMQRFARELDAYVAFCGTFLPNIEARRELGRLEVLPSLQRRGSIFGAGDIMEWAALYIDKDVPTYVLLWERQYRLVDDERCGGASFFPFSVIPDAVMSKCTVFLLFFTCLCLITHWL